MLHQYRSRLVLWASLFILASQLAQANDPKQVGLVVVHGNGNVTSQCITFQGEEINGYELLEQSNLDLNIDASNSMGATICRLDGEGCSYPQDDCFCQCQSSRNCIYWSYWHLNGDQWQYSNLGSSSYTLHGGEVQGWVWSKGSVGSSAEKAPPQTSFEAICAPPPTETPTETSTATMTPSATATASPTETATPPPPTATPTHELSRSTQTFDEVGLATAATPTPTPEPLTVSSQPTITVEIPTTTPTSSPQNQRAAATATLVSYQPPEATASPTDSPTATETVQLNLVDTPQTTPTPLEILPTSTPLPTPTSLALAAVTTPTLGQTLPPLAIEKRRLPPTNSPPENTSWLIFGTLASVSLVLLLALPIILLMVGGVVWWFKGRQL